MHTKIVGAVATVVIIGAPAVWLSVGNPPETVTPPVAGESPSPSPTSAGTPTPTPPPAGGPTPVPVFDTRKYRDGSYSATGNYISPAGAEQVEITLTINNDIITNATFIGTAVNPTSKTLQGRFAAGFEEFVVGKSVDSISLTVVNGSSLAPKGFMDALAKIKVQAAA